MSMMQPPSAPHAIDARLDPVVHGQLVFLRCVATRRPQAYGVRRCDCCWSNALEAVPAQGYATLVAAVRYGRTYDERWPHPHVVAVTRLAEGPEVFVVLVNAPPTLPPRGASLRIVVDAVGVLRARMDEPEDNAQPTRTDEPRG